MSEHLLTILGIKYGEIDWDLTCQHGTHGWGIDNYPCWLQTWWDELGQEMLNIPWKITSFPIEVEPQGWDFDNQGECVTQGTISMADMPLWDWCGLWENEMRPTSEVSDPRVAATNILHGIDWETVIEEYREPVEGDSIEAAGLTFLLNKTLGRHGNKELFNSLHAWATSRMKPTSWCTEHEAEEGYFPFNVLCEELTEKDAPCNRVKGWYLDAYLSDFLNYAKQVFRNE